MVGGDVRHGRARNCLSLACGLSIALTSGPSEAEAQASSPTSDHQVLLDRYCITCHSDALRDRGAVPLSLASADLADVPTNAELWEKVIRKLRTGSMPPAGRPRPDQPELDSLAQALEDDIDRLTRRDSPCGALRS